MASTNILEFDSPSIRQRRCASTALKTSGREVVLATRLSYCLEDMERGASIGSVISGMEREVADEIAPLLEIAQALKLRKSALSVC